MTIPDDEPVDWSTRSMPLGPPAAPVAGSAYPPPVQRMPPPYPPPARKKGLGTGAIVAIVLGSLVAVVCLGGIGLVALGADGVASTPKPTVDITGCKWDGYFGHLTYLLRNNDKRPHDYRVEATKGHSPMIPDVLKNVAPGEVVSGEMVGGSDGDCRITRVDQI